ncbi:MAG: zinc ABC transporter substrate-binding protein, partial [Flavobacteriales bacterium]|nr:zinc ABC transporter substrate-binding protein [Flavobacteriales bacterium]
DSAEVTSIMGPGTDPHIYKPTPSDIELMDDADVIIANGLHLEGKMSDMLKQYGEEKPVIFVSDGLAKKDLIKSADFEDSFDPHIWFDWKLWMEGMSYVTEELGNIDALSQSYFEDNYKDYESDVRQTHLDVEDYIQEIPEEKRVLITSHDAFSYFGRRYNVEVRGIQGISTLSEVGLKDISDMVDFVIEKEIRSIFVETSTSDKTAQSIVDGCKDKGYELKLDGPLYSDALGEPDSEGGSYVGMILANAKTIAEGLKE